MTSKTKWPPDRISNNSKYQVESILNFDVVFLAKKNSSWKKVTIVISYPMK